MARIAKLETGLFRIPLPVALTDSTHGEMAYFELVTARLTDSDGIQGVGYTYAVNHGGASIQRWSSIATVSLEMQVSLPSSFVIWISQTWVLRPR